jgi:twitching motility protein PilT
LLHWSSAGYKIQRGNAMARLDAILERLFREQAVEASFEAGTSGLLRTDDGDKALFKMSLTAAQIITAFTEIAPADVRPTFPKEGTTRFAYESALGKVQVSFEKADGMVRASISPADGAAPADGFSPPAGSATNVPIQSAPRPEARRPLNVGKLSKPTDPRAQMDELLRYMVLKKASDIHLTSGNPPILRLDGSLVPLPEWGVMSNDQLKQTLFAITPERNRAQWEEIKDTDFAHETEAARFRVNLFADRKGIGAAMRQIPNKILTVEEMMLPKTILDLAYLTKGLVLVTGPTGSGKSTTLAALVDYVNRVRDDHLITIEDPIEFVHQNKKCLVTQREVGVHTGSFKHALRAALREDPDVVLVGEMRDLETIAIAIETAETGHLVFGTLHTNTAPSTVDRIIDQFPTDRQAQVRVMLSESLKAVIAQTICKKIGGGRVPAMEVLMVNGAVANLIREGKTFQIMSSMQTSKGQGMQLMNDALFDLVKRNLIEPKEAYIKAVHKSDMRAQLERANFRVDLNE